MKAWYFSDVNRQLRYGDNRPIACGITHTVDCEPIMCVQGLHGSVNILDALKYAPGPYVWRVNLSGEVVRGADKVCATSREYIWGYDATAVLRKFARRCALDVVHLWDAPPIVVQYLKTGDESIRLSANAAARTAAWAWARASARDAARAAEWASTGAAARNAEARTAARTAEWAAAWDVAWDAAVATQSRRLYRAIMEASDRVNRIQF